MVVFFRLLTVSSVHSMRLFLTVFPVRTANKLSFSSQNLIMQLNRRYAHTLVKHKPEYVSRKFPEQSVKIETCGKLYEDWRKQKRFRNIPDGNLQFNIRYVDSLRDGSDESVIDENSCPTVLLMHGAPGSYEDFSLLIHFLWEHGIRVIAPCFPDFSVFPPGVFRHSVEEKTQLIRDFLQAINVQNLDLLVCHSSAVYPGLQLCVDNNKPCVSSLALLNPGAYSTKMNSTRGFPVLKKLVSLSEIPIGLKMLQSIAPTLFKYIDVPVRVDNPLNVLFSATVMVYANIPKAREHLHELSVRQFPILLAFSDDDKMIQKELSYRIAYKLGVQDPDISYVTSDGTVSKEGRIIRNVQAIAFENGSHYVFSRYPKIVNEAIFSFLQKYVL